MASTVTTAAGTRLTLDDELGLVEGAVEAPPSDVDLDTAVLLDALARGDVRVADEFRIVPAPARGRRARRSVEGAGAVVEVPSTEGELEALLIERDGVFAWQLPEAAPPRRRGGRAAAAPASVFRIGPSADATVEAAGGRRGWLIDTVLDTLFEPVRVVVLKFAARTALNLAERHLEDRVGRGFVRIETDDPNVWIRSSGASGLAFPSDRAARILLLVHGTFSSTAGSFGALGVTPHGKALLSSARAHYDAVLGFDHPTLTETPEANAAALLDGLRALSLPKGAAIDAVGYSRGGLVTRVLAERLLPAAGGFSFGTGVFVGATNGGTALAEPDNWKALLDLYTNIAIAAGRTLAFFDAGTASTVVTETIKTLSGLVQAVVDAAITEEMVPGLAAMRPTSPLVTALNAADARAKGKGSYFAVGTDFRTSLGSSTTSLPLTLVRALLDRGVDRLIGGANDLVVDEAAMIAFGARQDRVVTTMRFDPNDVIFHTNYLQQPDVTRALGAWLDVPATRGGLEAALPAPMTTVDGGRTLGTALKTIGDAPDDAVVVIERRGARSDTRDGVGHYVRTASAFRTASETFGPRTKVENALDLHEEGVADIVKADRPPETVRATGAVRLRRGKVVGASLGPVPIPRAPLAPRLPMSALPEAVGAEALEVERTAVEEAARADGGGRPGRRRSGHTRGARAVAPEPEAAAEVVCHFGAEMPGTAPLGTPAVLVVTVAREELDITAGPTAATAAATVAERTPLEITVVPRANATVVGPATLMVRVPKPGQPDRHTFEISGKAAGPAEVWVDVRQDGRRIARMVLQPIFAAAVTATAVVSTHDTDPPLVDLRIIEIPTSAKETKLRFFLTSEDLNLQLDYEQTVNSLKEDYIRSVFTQLEGDWGDGNLEFGTFMRRLRSRGASLYRELVPTELKEALWKHRKSIGSIRVISQEPFIPWELLHIVEDDRASLPPDGNQFLAELGLVRWIANAGFAPASLSIGAGRARYVIPEYADPRYRLPTTKAEIELLEDLFQATSVEATSNGVLDAIGQPGGFDLLHFACHGTANEDAIWNASLLMTGRRNSDGSYFTDTIDADEVSNMANLSSPGGGQPIVFLNACQAGKVGRTMSGGTGGMAEAFVKRGAGLFVGALWSVGDGTALTFAETFYGRLRDGGTVVDATKAAREAAKAANEPTWLAYTVYGHPYARVDVAARKPAPAVAAAAAAASRGSRPRRRAPLG